MTALGQVVREAAWNGGGGNDQGKETRPGSPGDQGLAVLLSRQQPGRPRPREQPTQLPPRRQWGEPGQEPGGEGGAGGAGEGGNAMQPGKLTRTAGISSHTSLRTLD